jgi:hypothetical protein
LRNELLQLAKYLFFIFLLLSFKIYAQQTVDSTDTTHKTTKIAPSDSLNKRQDLSLRNNNAVSRIPDSLRNTRPISNFKFQISNQDFPFITNTTLPSQFYVVSERSIAGKEILFYIIIGFLLLVGIFRAFYSGYLMNLFRVLFNTSMRQGQITDILLQSRLSSLIFNMIFLLSAGLYVWLLLCHYNIIPSDQFLYVPLCIVLIMMTYLVKYLVIKFVGWIAGMQESASQYIFIIFLINKIVAFILLPFIVLIAFGPSSWLPGIILLSLLILASLFIVRYLRTYGNLQSHLQVSLFHFFIYLCAAEIMPLLILYKSIFHLIDYASRL